MEGLTPSPDLSPVDPTPRPQQSLLNLPLSPENSSRGATPLTGSDGVSSDSVAEPGGQSMHRHRQLALTGEVCRLNRDLRSET